MVSGRRTKANRARPGERKHVTEDGTTWFDVPLPFGKEPMTEQNTPPPMDYGPRPYDFSADVGISEGPAGKWVVLVTNEASGPHYVFFNPDVAIAIAEALLQNAEQAKNPLQVVKGPGLIVPK